MDNSQDLRDSGDLPHPNLIQVHANTDQPMSLTEPEHPSEQGGASNLQQSPEESDTENSAAEDLETFGSLTHAELEKRFGAGYRLLLFYRKGLETLDYGLARANEDVYECAKMNILRHPRTDDYRCLEDDAASPGPIEGMNEDLLRLANYPHIENPVMSVSRSCEYCAQDR